ncbi:hypothetical protein Bpro_5503 (plasmid) [Polaromonas sp. JS666]|nr:hypothetical protein Bpro_5503 [Polaromonas sp. JS666]
MKTLLSLRNTHRQKRLVQAPKRLNNSRPSSDDDGLAFCHSSKHLAVLFADGTILREVADSLAETCVAEFFCNLGRLSQREFVDPAWLGCVHTCHKCRRFAGSFLDCRRTDFVLGSCLKVARESHLVEVDDHDASYLWEKKGGTTPEGRMTPSGVEKNGEVSREAYSTVTLTLLVPEQLQCSRRGSCGF